MGSFRCQLDGGVPTSTPNTIVAAEWRSPNILSWPPVVWEFRSRASVPRPVTLQLHSNYYNNDRSLLEIDWFFL